MSHIHTTAAKRRPRWSCGYLGLDLRTSCLGQAEDCNKRLGPSWQEVEPELPPAQAEALVEREEVEAEHALPGREGRCEVNRIEGSDRLAREGLARPAEDLGVERQRRPELGGSCEMSPTVGGNGFGEPTGGDAPDERSLAFDPGQLAGEDDLRGRERVPHSHGRCLA